jgi:four helix bundle protein
MSQSYKDLIAWQKSMDLVVSVYAMTRFFPVEERYGLVSQIRRSAVSVPSNIAEGHGRLTDSDRRHFTVQARGSLLELETQLEIAQRLGCLSTQDASTLQLACAEVGRILNGLLKSLSAKVADAD